MERMTLSQAKKLGLKKYLPLHRCKYNHDCFRVTRFNRCMRCFAVQRNISRKIAEGNSNPLLKTLEEPSAADAFKAAKKKAFWEHTNALWDARLLDIWLKKETSAAAEAEST